jgi:hypothetical protein
MISNLKMQSIDTSRILANFRAQLLAVVKSCEDKEELTNEERFAFCFCANVPIGMKPANEKNVITWHTLHKCAVVKLDGKWTVVVDDDSHVK